MSNADILEVEKMVQAGALDPNATRSALEYIAVRWIEEQCRRRERKIARSQEAPRVRLESSGEARKRVNGIVAQFAEKARHNWSDLLTATFALPNGNRVTWGAATVAQHAARAEQLEVFAAGNLESAALHRAAIVDIEAAGVETLGQIK